MQAYRRFFNWIEMDYKGAKEYILLRLSKELPAKRTYHCFEHTMDVYSTVMDIAEKEKVEGEDLELLKLAALYHDCGFMMQDHEHEMASCKIMREKLIELGYTEEATKMVYSMVMSTKIPQSPKTLLERIICDADLDYLGRNDFFLIGDTLFEEMKVYGILNTFDEWNELQVKFLEAHSYWTETNIDSRTAKKAENLQRVKDLLNNKKARS